MHHATSLRHAFTLPELLLSLALTVVIMTAAAIGLHAAGVSHSASAEKTDLVARARGVVGHIAHDVRSAKSVSVANSRTLQITMQDDSTRTYTWDGVVGGNLTLTVNTGTPVSATLTRQVASFSVTDNDPAVVVRLTLQGHVAKTQMSVSVMPSGKVF